LIILNGELKILHRIFILAVKDYRLEGKGLLQLCDFAGNISSYSISHFSNLSNFPCVLLALCGLNGSKGKRGKIAKPKNSKGSESPPMGSRDPDPLSAVLMLLL